MKICRSFISFIFLTLQDGNTGLCNAEIPVHTGIEGGNITVQCSFYVFGKWKLVCKEECEENILIKTTKDAARRGRYFITYKEERFPTHHAFLYVSITQLQKSDSGLYRCYLDRRLDLYLYEGFQLNVIEASTSSTTIKPTLALQSVSPPTITSSKQSEISTVDSGFLWPVVISVVLVVLVLSVGLIYKKKTVDSSGLNRRRNLDYNKTQIVLYENCPLVSPPEESVYQSLDAASRDQDQAYFTLRDIKAQMMLYQ